jgi:hypothetical protein
MSGNATDEKRNQVGPKNDRPRPRPAPRRGSAVARAAASGSKPLRTRARIPPVETETCCGRDTSRDRSLRQDRCASQRGYRAGCLGLSACSFPAALLRAGRGSADSPLFPSPNPLPGAIANADIRRPATPTPVVIAWKLRAPSPIWRVAARLEAGDPGGRKRLAQACGKPAGAPTPDARELRQGA